MDYLAGNVQLVIAIFVINIVIKKYQYTCAATLRRTEQASILVLFLLGCRNVTGPHQNRLADFQKSTSPR